MTSDQRATIHRIQNSSHKSINRIFFFFAGKIMGIHKITNVGYNLYFLSGAAHTLYCLLNYKKLSTFHPSVMRQVLVGITAFDFLKDTR